jgi:hypothetical protein
MAIRGATAHSVVFYLKSGASVSEAGIRAMQDLDHLGGRYLSGMNIVALDRGGTPGGFSSIKDRTFIYQTDEMSTYEETMRTFVDITQRWG